MTIERGDRRKPGTQRIERRLEPTRLLLSLGISVVYTLVWYRSLSIEGPQNLMLPSIVLSLTSIYVFFCNGRKAIVGTAAISYGILVFVGFPAFYTGLGLYSTEKVSSADSLVTAVSLAFIFQIMIFLLSVNGTFSLNDKKRRNEFSPTSGSIRRRSLGIAIFAFSCAGACRILDFSIGSLATGWIAMLFAAFSAFDSEKRRINLPGSLVLLLISALMFGSDIGGFGRLNLGVLIISVAIFASISFQSWWVKISVVLLTSPALIFLASRRLEFIEREQGRIPNELEGIGSVVGPFHSAAVIIDASNQDQIGMALGTTVLVAALLWIPRTLWAGKPDGFGREIVELTQPWLVGVDEHSDAGTIIGEAVWNFGVWGSLLFFLIIILALRIVDRRLMMPLKELDSLSEVLKAFIFVILASSTLNLVWGGFFTTVSRSLLPIAILLFISLLSSNRLKHKNLKNKS